MAAPAWISCVGFRESCPAIEVIILTAYGTVEGAVEAMKLGAYDYVAKPVDRERLGLLIERHSKSSSCPRKTATSAGASASRKEYSNIIGNCTQIRAVFKVISEVAPTNATVLITGESGTGKELVARAIHDRSGRKENPFVSVNCGALPDTLMESELFGYEKGAIHRSCRHQDRTHRTGFTRDVVPG